MFKGRDVLTGYRLLEFPNETAQSWPVARRERDGLPIRLLSAVRDAGRAAKTNEDRCLTDASLP